jgi:DNA-binding transcriptional LysR family regulator
MEFRHFRYVLAVAEELNFGRAAARLNMSQPPLSQQIRQVEEELGVRLFHRTKRVVELTDAGRAFVAGAREVVSQASRTAASAIAASRGEVGEITVATITTTDSSFYKAFVTIVRAFAARTPMVHLRLRQLSVQQQLDALHTSRIDVAFVTLPVRDSRLEVHVVHREPLSIAVPEDHHLAKYSAVPVTALAAEPHIIMPPRSNHGFYDLLTSYFRDRGVTLEIGDESDGIYTSLALVAAGRGVSVLPSSVLEVERPGIVIRPFDGPSPTLEMGVAYVKGRRSPVLDQFIGAVKGYVRAARVRGDHRRDRRIKTRTSPRAG